MTIRELRAGETARAARALLELRPALGSAGALVRRIDEIQRPGGYRLAGAFDEDEDDAAAVAGFRIAECLAWGRQLYVDDLVTAADRRGRGHADELFVWLVEEGRREGCGELHLDSGLGPDRQDAHRFYFRHGLRIASFHFAREL
ncbi:MAG TPA: GNAT family N-acetyltransferase [Solirubrobacteraceae bacterium]|nr:GNAT family N-acetyltransferase [Solirubrobacteraceae bacterium]